MKVPNQEIASSRWIFASLQDLQALSCRIIRAWSSLIAAMRCVLASIAPLMAFLIGASVVPAALTSGDGGEQEIGCVMHACARVVEPMPGNDRGKSEES
ncbi:hypothetical protein [Dyella monticola]|uniref:hypothetical protein n=1 Tax=Dyella monticola TaxID=1927958 RepID=UPI0011C0317E|nr:hypothetical protein [Dyella monticola]